MIAKKGKPESIEYYIEVAPEEVQEKLRQMPECTREAAPGARESLKWGMPAYSYHRILVTFAVFKHHIGFYPNTISSRSFCREPCEI
ncbi:MAG: DUF1801 domain-containing protein [Segetibacter sp.]